MEYTSSILMSNRESPRQPASPCLLNGGMRDWVELEGDVTGWLHEQLDQLRHLAQKIDDHYASHDV